MNSIRKHLKRELPRQECLRPGCGQRPYERGLCVRCYQAAHVLVCTNYTSWEALEQSGKILKKDGVNGDPAREWLLEGAVKPVILDSKEWNQGGSPDHNVSNVIVAETDRSFQLLWWCEARERWEYEDDTAPDNGGIITYAYLRS